MIDSNAYNSINVLTSAADAAWTRNEVINNNIANVDTPGYKRKDVSFESYLLAELESGSTSNLQKQIDNVDLENINATIYTDMSTLSYRLDGNNVDIDTENVELASNQIRYNTLLDSITHEFNMIKASMSQQ